MRKDDKLIARESEQRTRYLGKNPVFAFDATVPLEGVASVVEAFDKGWAVEVGADMPSSEYLEGLDEIPGLREAAAQLAGGDSPARLASAIEFVLEGLHLSNRLSKRGSDAGSRYARP